MSCFWNVCIPPYRLYVLLNGCMDGVVVEMNDVSLLDEGGYMVV